MRGVYVLVIRVERPTEVTVGKLGRMRFAPGTYVYVGSGMQGLEARIRRHLRSQKKLRWHIDYLLARSEARVVGIYIRETLERLECRVAESLAAEFEVIEGFGASDCRCRGHLFRCTPGRLEGILKELGFQRLEEVG